MLSPLGQWIDTRAQILEVFGHRRGAAACSTVHNMLHSWGTKDPLDGACTPLEQPRPGWHVWKLYWTPTRIAFYIDDDEQSPVWAYERPQASNDLGFPYTQPQYLIANIAVGGNGPAEPVDEAALASGGTSMHIDYVRVYELSAGEAVLATSVLSSRAIGGSSVHVAHVVTWIVVPLAAVAAVVGGVLLGWRWRRRWSASGSSAALGLGEALLAEGA
jgi:hypothetical protein